MSICGKRLKFHSFKWILLLIVYWTINFLLAEETSNSKSIYALEPPWAWVCRNQTCVKIEKGNSGVEEKSVSLPVCKLNCAPHGVLWPKPTGKVEIGPNVLRFYSENVGFNAFQTEDPEVRNLFEEGTKLFRQYLPKMCPGGCSEERKNSTSQNKVLISVGAVWTDKKVTLKTDESYVLSTKLEDDKKTVSVTITANTYFGARHGLETLSQLIAYDETDGSFVIVTNSVISDKPVYKYRGLMLDTSRNYFSVDSIKRIIDGMSYIKLNVFHWHITDTHSFPFYSKRQPKLTQYGAYSPRQIYTVEDMKNIVAYATVRGIKVVPEFDQPAHTGNGWNWGPSQGLGDLAVCVNQEPWQTYCVEPPCGQLNVVNENLFPILRALYKDFLDIFDNDLFHMGGDEINFNCWNSTAEITTWLTNQGQDLSKESFIDLWGKFQERAYQNLRSANNGNDISAILWTSEITGKEYVEKYLNNSRYIIQIWETASNDVIPLLIGKQYNVIFSNYDAMYLDCGYGGWVGAGPNNWCSPYKGWQQIYENSPVKIYANFTSAEVANKALKEGKILGGVAPLWSEQVDEHAAESKIFPRAASLAERFWTNPKEPWSEAEFRMIHTRQRMVERGIRADRLQPQWCHQNENHCYL